MIVACAAITHVLGVRITARIPGVFDLGGEKGGENMLYVVRVFHGAVCFWKKTFDDWIDAVMCFDNYSESAYSHIVLELINDQFTETWIKLPPFPKNLVIVEGGENNE